MANSARSRSFLGKGTIYAREIGAGDKGLITLGNCSELSLAFNEDKKEQSDYEVAGGGLADSVTRISSVTASVTALSLSPRNVGLALRAVINYRASEVVAAESHTAHELAFIALNKLYDASKVVTVTNVGASTTYVVDVDYALKNGGIIVVEGGNIADGSDILVSYTTLNSWDIEGLAASGQEYEIVFDGLNEADSGKAAMVTMHRVKFNPTSALGLITDDYGSLPMTFDVLKDTTKTGSNESQYIKLQFAD